MISKPATLTRKCIGVCDGSKNANPDLPTVVCDTCEATKNCPLTHDEAAKALAKLRAAKETEIEKAEKLISNAENNYYNELRKLQAACLHQKSYLSCVQYEARNIICHACGGTVR
jgi:hypothetical protein